MVEIPPTSLKLVVFFNFTNRFSEFIVFSTRDFLSKELGKFVAQEVNKNKIITKETILTFMS